jgi:hypothetical protein
VVIRRFYAPQWSPATAYRDDAVEAYFTQENLIGAALDALTLNVPRILFRDTLMGDMDLNLVWMAEAEMLADLASFVSRHERGGFDEADRRDHAISG